MKKINILYLAPVRKGGPHISLKTLYNNLVEKNLIKANFYSSLKGFIYAIFTKKYDLIHTVLPLPFNIWGTPIILNIRGNYKLEKNIIKNPLAYIYPISIFFSEQIVSPSKFMVKKLNLKKVKIIPNFVKEDLLKLEKLYISKKVIKLCIITKFHFEDKSYGVIKLLNIISKLQIKEKIELNIFGDGIYLEKIKKEVSKLKLPKNINVHWLGFVNNPYELFLEQDIHCYYSNLDNFPNSVLESMAIGIPTITNDVGAVNEFIINKETGFICNNDKDYLDFLIQLIKCSKLRKKIGKAGKEYVKKNFSMNFVSNEFLKIYHKVYKKK